MLAMTLAILIDIFSISRISKWLVIIVMCFAIIGNIMALHKDSQTSSALLNVLKNLGSLNDVHERIIEENQVFQFFKSKKKNNATGYSANVYVVKGIGFAERGRYQRAFEDFNKAILLKPDFTVAYVNRGVTYFKQDNIEMGCSDAQKACKLGDCSLLETVKVKEICRRFHVGIKK
jgi:tetratricopeptide (TPR) repeat protein